MMQSGEKKKGEQIIETQRKTQGASIMEISENGIKIQINSKGESIGKHLSNDMGTTTVSVKADGNSEWESKGIQITHDGEIIASRGNGTAKSTWSGEMHFMTQSPKLAWMNAVTFWIEGVGDNSKEESSAKVYQTK